MNQSDLFGQSARVSIPDNPLLARIANELLDMIDRNPALLDGDSIGIIDRRLAVAMWLDNGLRSLIPDVVQRGKITAWLCSKECTDEEAVSRARRYLESKDLIRLSAAAVKNAEQHRERIARSMKR